jgi:hypothetical protein
MGTLRSASDCTGMKVNMITLGEPARDLDDNNEPIGGYRWDDSRLPNGVIDGNGNIKLDKVD